jgi:hypothetical protein
MDNWYTGKIRSPLLQGPTIELGGQSFTIAATPNALKKVAEHAKAGQAAGQQGDTAAQFTAMLTCAAVLLKTNYIEITPELLGENVSIVELVNKVVEVIQLVMADAVKAANAAFSYSPKPKSELSN